MKDEITLEDFVLSIAALWKHKVLILAVTIFALLAGLLYTVNADTGYTYCATTSIYSATYGSYQLSVTGSNAIRNYSDVLTSRKICERAASILGDSTITIEAIQSMISASYSESENVMKVSAYSKNPKTAVSVANVVADSFVLEVSEITGTDAIKVLDAAQSSYISSNGRKKNLLLQMIFACAGFGMICIYLIIIELFSDKLKTLNKCEMLAEHKILGILPEIES